MSIDSIPKKLARPTVWCATAREILNRRGARENAPSVGIHREIRALESDVWKLYTTLTQSAPQSAKELLSDFKTYKGETSAAEKLKLLQALHLRGKKMQAAVDSEGKNARPQVDAQPQNRESVPSGRAKIAFQNLLDRLQAELAAVEKRIEGTADARSKIVRYRDFMKAQQILTDAKNLVDARNGNSEERDHKITQVEEFIAKSANWTQTNTQAVSSVIQEPLKDDPDEVKRKESFRKNLSQRYMALLRFNPADAKQILKERASAMATQDMTTLIELRNEVDRRIDNAKTQGEQLAQQAVADINKGKLEGLGVERQIELLSQLHQGSPDSLEKRQAAMAKLYEVTPLQPEFARNERKKRGAVLRELGKDPNVAEFRQNWAAWGERDGQGKESEDGKQKKVAALQYVLDKQKDLMGIRQNPEIVIFTKGKEIIDGCERFDQGSFGFESRTLEVNDHADGDYAQDFDKAMITMLHENTHNYQAELVDKLIAGELTAETDKEYYHQTLLFLLNQKAGYLVTPDAYEQQPTERHAFEADLEAKRHFKVDTDLLSARDECAILVERVDTHRQKARELQDTHLEGVFQSCNAKLKAAMQLDSAGDIRSRVASVKTDFDGAKYIFSNQVQLEAMRDEGQLLTRKIDELIKSCKASGVPRKEWLQLEETQDWLEEVKNGSVETLSETELTLISALSDWMELSPKLANLIQISG